VNVFTYKSICFQLIFNQNQYYKIQHGGGRVTSIFHNQGCQLLKVVINLLTISLILEIKHLY